MFKLMLQKFPFYSRIPALMRLYWYSADGSAEETGASGRMSNTILYIPVYHHRSHLAFPSHCTGESGGGGGRRRARSPWKITSHVEAAQSVFACRGAGAAGLNLPSELLARANVLILMSSQWSESLGEQHYIPWKAIFENCLARWRKDSRRSNFPVF